MTHSKNSCKPSCFRGSHKSDAPLTPRTVADPAVFAAITNLISLIPRTVAKPSCFSGNHKPDATHSKNSYKSSCFSVWPIVLSRYLQYSNRAVLITQHGLKTRFYELENVYTYMADSDETHASYVVVSYMM